MMTIAEQIDRRLLVCPLSRLPLVIDGEILRVDGADYTYPFEAGLPILLPDPEQAAARLAALRARGRVAAPAAGSLTAIGAALRGEGLRSSGVRAAFGGIASGVGLRLEVGTGAITGGSDLVRVAENLGPAVDVLGDPHRLPYSHGAAEALALTGFERLPGAEEALAEAFRVLRPGGGLFVDCAAQIDPRSAPAAGRLLSADALAALARAAGFEVAAQGPAAGPLAALAGRADAVARTMVPAGALERLAGAAAAAALLPLRALDPWLARSPRALPLAARHWLRARRPEYPLPAGPLRLHIGSGFVRLPGWLNVDLQALAGVDVVADVTQGLLFQNVEAIYAEHFLEHLRIDHAVSFLADARQALRPGGVLRLSTPNLDWVLATNNPPPTAPRELRIGSAIVLNRAFHGWRHQFLWNRETLTEALLACGFAGLRWHRHGESERELLRGIEHHETYPDEPALPHVLIVEAEKSEAQPARLKAFRAQIASGFLAHLAQ